MNMENSFVQRLYRYRSIATSELAEFARQIVVDNKLYFASLDQVNDPFEFRLADSSTREEPSFDEKLRARLIHQGISRLIAIVSFTEVVDDLLLWSHYADGHRGICLVFDVDVGRAPFSVYPVAYWDLAPPLNDAANLTMPELHMLCTTKTTRWQHEHEWRAIDVERGPGVRLFPSSWLTGVILGSRCPTEHVAMVRKWIAEREQPVRLYQAVPTGGHDAIKVVEWESAVERLTFDGLEPFLRALAECAKSRKSFSEELLVDMKTVEQNGYKISGKVRLIAEGERSRTKLMEGLDFMDAHLISRLLELIRAAEQ